MIAGLIGMGLSMLGSSGIFDKEYTQTNVDYSKFGNFAQAGKLPNVVSGQISTETDEVVTNTGISDMLSMGGDLTGIIGQAIEGITKSIKASGSASSDIKTQEKSNTAENKVPQVFYGGY